MSLGLGSKLTKGGVDPYAMYRSRYSVRFDGTNDFIEIDDSTTFDHVSGGDSQFTIACWFKVDVLPSVADQNMTLMAKFDAGNSKREWMLFLRKTDDKPILVLSTDGSGDSSGDSDDTMVHNDVGSALTDTKWHHIMVSYNGSPSQAINSYIDGVAQTINKDGQLDSDFEAINQDDAKVYIGAYLAGSMSYHMIGYIADPIYINRLVGSSNHATAMYNNGKPKNLSTYVGYSANMSRAYWQMGDGTEKASGTTLYDMAISSNDDNGTLTNGPTFKNESPGLGRDSYSFAFDGTNDFVDVGPSDGLVTGNTVTVAFWAKVTDTHRAYVFANARGDVQSNFAVALNQNGTTLSAGVITGLVWTGSAIATVSYDGNIDDSAWHHYAFTTTASAQVLYLDGVAVATGSNTFSNAAHADHNTHIGNLKGGSFYLGGNIADMVLFNTTLTAAQVRENMGPGLDLNNLSTGSDITAWWRFGDGTLDYKGTTHAWEGCLGDENNPTVGSDILGGKGDFSDSSYWDITSGQTIVEDGKGKWLGNGSYAHIRKTGILTAGKIYEVTLDVDSNVGPGSKRLNLNFSDVTYPYLFDNGETGKGLKSYFQAEDTDFIMYSVDYHDKITIGNLTVRLVNGIPGVMRYMQTDGYDIVIDAP